MKNLVSTYVDQFRQDRQKQLKLLAILAALAIVVAGVVFWQLHSTGVAMTNEVFCGQEEHVHDDGCYEQILICSNEEEDHIHDASCYETVLTCQIPEHMHTVECLMDESADVETADVWEETLPELSDVWADNVVAIAESQIGYTESTANFVLADDGETHMGYTRYGAWYGNEYGDWDAMFVAFCLNYAGVPENDVAESSGAYALAVQLAESGLYVDTAEFTPVAGDLIFFDDDEDGAADRVGIVTAVGENVMTVVEGNVDGAVVENTYFADDDAILSYGVLPEQEGVNSTETGDGVLTYLAADGGVTVKVNAPADALPAGAELSVSLLDESSVDYAEAAEAVGSGSGNGFAVLDICFLLDGEEIEPSGPVTVNMNISGLLPENAADIVIHHLEESPAGVDPEIVTTLSGADQSNSIEFEVDSFSKFTIEWNDGTQDIITVHVYNMKGAGIEEVLDTEYTHGGGDILISDIVKNLHGTVSSSHYEYATVYYEMATGGGYEAYTVGNVDNPVTEISKEGTTYTVTLSNGNGSNEIIASPDTIDIHLYYSIPTVTITAANEHDGTGTIELTANSEYFKGLDAADSVTTYVWTLSDESVGTISSNENNNTAVFTWADETEVGTSVTVQVTMTNTYIDDNEDEITESASDTYTLTYGEQAVTITVTSSDSTAQENAHVALVDYDSGNTVATGTTGSDGTVTLYAIPGTYTVGSTYVVATSTTGPGATTRYTGESTIIISGEVTGTVTLNEVISSDSVSGSSEDSSYDDWGDSSPYYYEHIDVKAAVAEIAGANEVFSDLDSVYVYDKYGNLIYSSDDLIANEGTGDYNCRFDLNGAEDVHSIVVSSEDTIVITYEVIVTNDDGTTETKTYTATLSNSNYYPADEYYSYSDVNAWQLYDVIYNANITEDDWDTALENGTLENLLGVNYNENGIPIGGLSYIRVADYLCDSRQQTGSAGLDFVIDVAAVDVTSWDFTIAKTFTGVSEEVAPEDKFTFDLYEVESPAEQIWTLSAESAPVASGSTTEWTLSSDGIWTSDIQMTTDPYETDASQLVYYYILKEADTGYTESDVDAYGIQVMITIDSETGAPSVVSVSYTDLTLTASGESGSSYSGGTLAPLNEITDDDGNSLYVLPFVNTYAADTSVDIYKYTEDYTNAIWTSTTAIDGNPDATDTYYLRYSTTDENDEPLYYYAIGTGSGTSLDDPFVVTDWTTDQDATGVISASVAANAGATYYFSGEMGTEDVYFEFTGTTTEINESITVVEGTNMAGLEGAEFRLTGIGDETTGTSSVAWFSVSTEDDLTVYTFVGWDLSEGETEGYTDVITSGADGYIHIVGIPAGEYTLTETLSPDGYNRIIGSITFTVDSDGNLDNLNDESGRASVINMDDGIALAVENIAGTGLPNTGGSGTWMYTMAGLLLITGAAYLLYKKTRGRGPERRTP